MTISAADTRSLRESLEAIGSPSQDGPNDYRIAIAIGSTFLARSRSHSPTLLIPLASVPTGAGRRGGGFALSPASCVAFEFEGSRWEQPAATFECTEQHLVDTFLVLVEDLNRKLAPVQSPLTWQLIVAWLEEWQTLLAPRATLTAEQQLGLWGELWVISKSRDPGLLIAAWQGPDREAIDFFLNGLGMEVKASRLAHTHHVSRRQVESPKGTHRCYLLSIWAGVDPARGRSLPDLFDDLLGRVPDPPELLKRVLLLGYVPLDRDHYSTKWLPLESPRWYRAEDVPQIRAMDPGISSVRYVVALDPERSIEKEAAHDLWAHFCNADPTSQ